MISRSRRTLYVGNLPGDIREREVEDLFYKVFLGFAFDSVLFYSVFRICFIKLFAYWPIDVALLV